MSSNNIYHFLSGDIGGTNSRFQLFEVQGTEGKAEYGKKPPGVLRFENRYMNENFASFVHVVKQFLSDAHCQQLPTTACFAVAGPVDSNSVSFTNRGWTIYGDQLATELGIKKVVLINDFVANGYGLLTLGKQHLHVLQDVPPKAGQPIACIGAGTGLGECFLTAATSPDGKEYHYSAWPSEGGHAEFAPRNELEIELLKFLKNKFSQKNRVSVERVVSGHGLANVYEFLSHHFKDKVNPEIHKEIENRPSDAPGIIAKNANNDELCSQAMDIMISTYGAETGVVALKYLPYGGLYIAGGIAPKNIDRFTKNNLFLSAFHDKGRVSPILKQVPIYLVTAEEVGQMGAHLVAYNLLYSIISS